MGLRNAREKERLNADTDLVWAKSLLWNGEQTKVGDPIPETLRANRGRLKSFWEARVITYPDDPRITPADVVTAEAEAPADEVVLTGTWRDLTYEDQVALARENGLLGRLPKKPDLYAFLEEKLG